jgi:hypothetical protein
LRARVAGLVLPSKTKAIEGKGGEAGKTKPIEARLAPLLFSFVFTQPSAFG